jgi:hypothetical protein
MVGEREEWMAQTQPELHQKIKPCEVNDFPELRDAKPEEIELN